MLHTNLTAAPLVSQPTASLSWPEVGPEDYFWSALLCTLRFLQRLLLFRSPVLTPVLMAPRSLPSPAPLFFLFIDLLCALWWTKWLSCHLHFSNTNENWALASNIQIFWRLCPIWRGTGKMFFYSITLLVSWLFLDRAIIFCLWNCNFAVIYLATFLKICTSFFWSGRGVGHVLPPPGEQSQACTSLLPLLCVVSLSFQGSGSSWAHWALLASCVLLQNQNLSCTGVGKASWAVSSDWKSGVWPGKGLCSLEMSVSNSLSSFSLSVSCLELERSLYLLHPRNVFLLGTDIVPVVQMARFESRLPASWWTAVNNHISVDLQTLCVLFFLDFLLTLYLGRKPIWLLQT